MSTEKVVFAESGVTEDAVDRLCWLSAKMNGFTYITCWVLGSVCIGLVIGYFLGRSSPLKAASNTPHPEHQATLRVLEELLEAAQRMSADVECHNSQISKSVHDVGDLKIQGELESVKQVLLGHMTGMLTSNKQLQDDLSYSRYQMEEQAQEIDEVRRQARTDALTGVANRTSFDEKLHFLFATWQREQRPFVLLMVDLDHFKRINDSHGHPAGDRVLEEVGGWLKEGLRETDFVARYGGDEFTILLPATELTQGIELAERVRSLTGESAHRVAVRGAMVSVALSVGVAAPSEDDTPESLLERADRALYAAKNAGRNRVCCQTSPDDSASQFSGTENLSPCHAEV